MPLLCRSGAATREKDCPRYGATGSAASMGGGLSLPRRPDLDPVPAVSAPVLRQPSGGAPLPVDDREVTLLAEVDREGEVVLERDHPQVASDVLRVARQEGRPEPGDAGDGRQRSRRAWVAVCGAHFQHGVPMGCMCWSLRLPSQAVWPPRGSTLRRRAPRIKLLSISRRPTCRSIEVQRVSAGLSGAPPERCASGGWARGANE